MNHNLFLAQDEGCLMGGTRILVAIMCGLFVNCRKTKNMFCSVSCHVILIFRTPFRFAFVVFCSALCGFAVFRFMLHPVFYTVVALDAPS